MEKECLQGAGVFLIHDFFSREECEKFIAGSEQVGFGAAPVTTRFGPVMMPEVRNNTRVMVDDFGLAARICERAKPFLPALLDVEWRLRGFNERLRYYRYDPGQTFAPHYDGAFMRNKNEISKLTFMLYLNDGFVGGDTKFFDEPSVSVHPVCGQALVFVHHKLHSGEPVKEGRKYVLRTDVMYGRA